MISDSWWDDLPNLSEPPEWKLRVEQGVSSIVSALGIQALAAWSDDALCRVEEELLATFPRVDSPAVQRSSDYLQFIQYLGEGLAHDLNAKWIEFPEELSDLGEYGLYVESEHSLVPIEPLIHHAINVRTGATWLAAFAGSRR